jgi:hypothetical protein
MLLSSNSGAALLWRRIGGANSNGSANSIGYASSITNSYADDPRAFGSAEPNAARASASRVD